MTASPETAPGKFPGAGVTVRGPRFRIRSDTDGFGMNRSRSAGKSVFRLRNYPARHQTGPESREQVSESSTGWRVPFRHQKKGYPTGYPFFYAFVRIGEIPGVCDTGINARTGPGCHVLRSQISRIPASPDPAAAEKRAVCNIPPCDSGRNPDQAFPSGFVPGRPAPAVTAGSAPLPRLL